MAAAVLLWELISRAEVVNPRLFPPPSQVFVALRQWFGGGSFWGDVGTSYSRMLAGFSFGGALGVIAGLATGRLRWVQLTLTPLLQALRPLPPVAIIPLVIVWLGIGNNAKVFSIAFAVFFPVWINTHLGSGSIPREYLWSARVLSASPGRTLLQVLLPATLPAVVAGLRTAIAIAFVMVYVSELAGASSGLGYRIAVAHLAYRIDLMMAALVVLTLAGALADALFARLTNMAFPWLRFQGRR